MKKPEEMTEEELKELVNNIVHNYFENVIYIWV